MIFLKHFMKGMLYMEREQHSWHPHQKKPKWLRTEKSFPTFSVSGKRSFLVGYSSEMTKMWEFCLLWKHANLMPGTYTHWWTRLAFHTKEAVPETGECFWRDAAVKAPLKVLMLPSLRRQWPVTTIYIHQEDPSSWALKKKLPWWFRSMNYKEKKQHDFRLSLPSFTQNSDLITRSCFFTKEDSFSSSLMTSIWIEVTVLCFSVSCSSCSFMTDAVSKVKHINHYLKTPKAFSCGTALHTPPSSQRETVAWTFYFTSSWNQA